MRHEPVRPRPRDLARLVEVTGRPERGTPRPPRPPPGPRRSSSASASPARAPARRTRTRAPRAGARDLHRSPPGARRRPDLRHAALQPGGARSPPAPRPPECRRGTSSRACSAAGDGTGRRRRATRSRRPATTVRCATGASGRRCRQWACRRRRRCARDRCRRTRTARRRARARRDPRWTWAATGVAAPADAATTSRASDSSPGPQTTTDVSACRSRSAAATAPSRDGAHRLVGHAAPGLSSAYRPPVRAATSSRRPRTRRDRSETPARRRGCRAARACRGLSRRRASRPEWYMPPPPGSWTSV